MEFNISGKLDDKDYLMELLFNVAQKQNDISEKLLEAKNNVLKEEEKEINHEADLWLNTNFKEKKCTNKEMREAYVKKEMKDFIFRKGKYKNEAKRLEQEYDIMTRIIKILTIYLHEVKVNDSRI